MCGILIIASVLLEAGGLGLVALQLTRVQRRELGPWRWTQRVRGMGRRLRRRSSDAHLQPLGVATSSDVALGTRVWRGPGETLEQRVASLEANLSTLRDQSDERQADLEQRLSGVSTRVDQVRADLERQHAERDQQRREQLRESVVLQWWGTGLFLLGAIAGGLANATC